jgi:hypothetical protein
MTNNHSTALSEDMDMIRDRLEDHCDSLEISAIGDSLISVSATVKMVVSPAYGCAVMHPQVAAEVGRFYREDGSLGENRILIRLASGRKASIKLTPGKVAAKPVQPHRTPTPQEIEDSIRATVPVSQYCPPAAAGKELSQPTLL